MSPGGNARGTPPPGTRVAVVGHVELVEFISVARLPEGGQVVTGSDAFTRAAGGGGVAASVLAQAGVSVELFTAFGDDDDGHAAVAQLTATGVTVHPAWRSEPTRRAVTLLAEGERAIVTIGSRLAPTGADPLPWGRLEEIDAAYFTAGDADALAHARRARVIVATPRAGAVLDAGPELDALVYSAADTRESALIASSPARARYVIATAAADGGHWTGVSEGRWAAARPDGPIRDSYGCGDTFAAMVTCGLGAGWTTEDAVALGADWGAWALTRPGAP